MLYGAVVDDAKVLRLYDCGSESEAQLMRDARAPWVVSLRMKWVTRETVVLDLMRAEVELSKRDVLHVAKLLRDLGVRHALAERAEGRRIPFARRIDDGPLAGLWHLEPPLVVSGADGDY